MRKTVLVVVLALVCLLLLAGPALAQKDPFNPVIDPNAGTGTTTTGTTTTGTVTTGDPTEPVGSEGLANTGADVEPWLVVAYGLVVLGGAAVIIARLQRPVPLRRD
jgi:hypothetical protein